MFIKDSATDLVFIKSKNINVFPCGRRRSEVIDKDNNGNTISDQYYLPFDPEARLNTEDNNRKHSGLNGFKQSYLNYWREDGSISFALEGYLFNIISNYNSVTGFIEDFKKQIDITNASSIYANIKLAKVQVFSGAYSGDSRIEPVYTWLLRNQTDTNDPANCLDMLVSGKDAKNSDSYFFSGLSFSSSKLEGDGVTSVKILHKDGETWKIHEPFRLPKLDHGDTPNSVKVPGDLEVAGEIKADGRIVANAFEVQNTDGTTTNAALLEVKPTDNGAYQLQFWTKPKNN